MIPLHANLGLAKYGVDQTPYTIRGLSVCDSPLNHSGITKALKNSETQAILALHQYVSRIDTIAVRAKNEEE